MFKELVSLVSPLLKKQTRPGRTDIVDHSVNPSMPDLKKIKKKKKERKKEWTQVIKKTHLKIQMHISKHQCHIAGLHTHHRATYASS